MVRLKNGSAMSFASVEVLYGASDIKVVVRFDPLGFGRRNSLFVGERFQLVNSSAHGRVPGFSKSTVCAEAGDPLIIRPSPTRQRAGRPVVGCIYRAPHRSGDPLFLSSERVSVSIHYRPNVQCGP